MRKAHHDGGPFSSSQPNLSATGLPNKRFLNRKGPAGPFLVAQSSSVATEGPPGLVVVLDVDPGLLQGAGLAPFHPIEAHPELLGGLDEPVIDDQHFDRLAAPSPAAQLTD